MHSRVTESSLKFKSFIFTIDYFEMQDLVK